MNVSCSQCHQMFSISADQLGTRGKCPHCRKTIILPRSGNAAQHYSGDQLKPPSYLSQNLLCALVTAFIHALLLSLMAIVPWGEFSDQNVGDGTLVAIGQLPKNLSLETSEESFETSEFEPENDSESFQNLDTELFSPTVDGEFADQSVQDFAFSAGDLNPSQFLFQSESDSNLLAGGSEDFASLLSRLKKDGLDVVITFDSTGSMQGEIDQVKNQINRIGSVLFELVDKTRIGVCTYRDVGDEYVVKGLPLTDNLTEVVLYLEQIQAAGGGDDPEAVEEGLRWATGQKFRRAARKVILVFGDAPPRPSQSLRCEKLASNFSKQGGIVSTVTCRKSRRLEDFVRMAKSGKGESFLTKNEREIMAQLVILVFGSQHRLKVIEAFDLLENQ